MSTAIAKPKADLLDPPPADSMVLMFERLATNPDVDVAKLEKLIGMQERILAHNARAEYDAAFAQMQGELPVITEQGQIEVDGRVRSTYARYEDIIAAVRPILQKYGFALRHRNEMTPDGKLKIIGILAHRSGHSEQDEFVAAPDTSGKKGDIQSFGSTRSYGQRYTTIALLNIVTRGTDDDGQSASRPAKTAPAAPSGYADWLADLVCVADNGLKALTASWNASKLEFRNHLLASDRAGWDGIKRRAKVADDKAGSR